ncbi:MAG: glycosyltransferase family 4 protein [Clostridiales bacterium]|nr:glycosyltransferase family 4 protein [Clostridiales bacterium]
MVKVCHVTSAHTRYDDRIFQKECMSLSKKGYQVHLIVNDDCGDEIIDNVYISSVNVGYNSRKKRILAINDILKKALEIDAEIYHLHDPELLAIAKKIKKCDKKVIFDSHEYYYDQIKAKQYLPQILRTIIAKLYYHYETYICKSIDSVVSVCPISENGRTFDQFEGRCKKNVYIANYPVQRNVGEKSYPDEFKVCYVGGLTYDRGITYLIDACYKAKCKLILAGTFDEKEYKNELERKESFACVEYRGQCNYDEVCRIYKEASLGAATLLNVGQYFKANTFSVKVFEYFQAKLPVMISNYPYAEKINKEHNFGISVKPDDINQMVEAIKYLNNNRDCLSELGNNGFQLYEDKMNWEQESNNLFELYNELLGEQYA